MGEIQGSGPRVSGQGRSRGLALLLALAMSAGCAAGRAGGPGASPAAASPAAASPAAASAEIVRELELSAERWNRGDLEGFLLPYLDAPTTTFVGSAGLLRGKREIEAQYRRSYFDAGAPRQTLRFAELEVRVLGNEHALALGRYRLFDAAGAQVAEGPFSLVFARTSDGWRIIHDHSS